jgi:hypothetical protein
MTVFVLDAERTEQVAPVIDLIASPIAATHLKKAIGTPFTVDDFVFLHKGNKAAFQKSLLKENRLQVVAYSGGNNISTKLVNEDMFYAEISLRDLDTWIRLFQGQVKSNSSKNIADSLNDFITGRLDSNYVKGLVSQFITLTAPNLLMGIPIRFEPQTQAVADELLRLGLVKSANDQPSQNNIVGLVREFL